MELSAYLESHHDALVNEATESLRRWRLEHYELDGETAIRDRLSRLLSKVEEAVRARRIDAMTRHGGELARERFEAGYGLREVQTAFNVLEETIWTRLLRDAAGDADLPAALGMVGTVLGMGKDATAREYVAQATHVRAPSLDLRALFGGGGDDDD